MLVILHILRYCAADYTPAPRVGQGSVIMLAVRGAAIRKRTEQDHAACSVYLFAPTVTAGAYLLLTLMTLGLVSSALGSVSVNTPFSKTASALSACTGTFNISVRDIAP